jgi:anti-anti-sigma factor
MSRTEGSQSMGQSAEDRAPTFAVRVLDAGEPMVLALEGEADIDCASVCLSRLKEAVCDSGHETVIVDLSACEFMDSSVLKTLIGVGWMARERNRNFVLSQPSSNLQRTFDLMRMEKFVTVTENPAHSPSC